MLLRVLKMTQRYRTKIKKNSMKATTRTSVKLESPKPNAWVVNTNDRGRKSIKSGNKIYLQNDQEFQIELHNPLTESVLADIRINGESVSKTGLILRPAERFYLDCFIDDKKKFIFKTYEVDNTTESKESITKNGSIEVYFFKEETYSLNNWVKKIDRIIERHYYPMYYPQWYPYPVYPVYPSYPRYYGGYNALNTYNPQIVGSTNLNYNSSNQIFDSNSTNVLYGGTNTSSSSSISQINDGSFNISSINNPTSLNSNQKGLSLNDIINNKVETGRVEKGSTSSQSFDDLDLDFEKYHISSVFYQILPESQKPVETSQLKVESKKKFCDECGTKMLKDISKFCHECGTKL